MFTIVGLAMAGSMRADRLQRVLYIGTMLKISPLKLLLNIIILRHLETRSREHLPRSGGHRAVDVVDLRPAGQ